MSAIKTLEIDAGASTMTIGPGVLFADILNPLYDAGKEMSKLTTNYLTPLH